MAKSEKQVRVMHQYVPTGTFALVAFVGAFVYFSHNAQNFGEVLFALVKAFVWPGILLYNVLQVVGA